MSLPPKFDAPPCPACDVPLCVAYQKKADAPYRYVLWCGEFKCPSPSASNDGSMGPTIMDALAKLKANIDREGMPDEET